MTQVPGRDYGERPKLTAESLDRMARVAVRILSAGAFQRAEGSKQRFVYWISTHTPPDHILFLTANDLREIVAKLGDETDNWRGKTVVVELVNRVYRGKTYEKYGIAPASDWDDVLRPLDAPPPGAKAGARPIGPGRPPPSAKRTAKKVGRKPRKRSRR